jgi:hypothetical protein
MTAAASTGGSAAIPGMSNSNVPSQGSQPGDTKSEDAMIIDEAVETRPQLLYSKIQQLKNTTKIAKVLVIDENPVVSMPSTWRNNSSTNENSADASGNRRSNIDRSLPLSPKSLVYYPLETHLPSEEAC